jgi:aryl-alcohol dehydrogenase-like predicted oxidoreductase
MGLVLGTLGFRTLTLSSVCSILDRYFDTGGEWIDTAALYGNGSVERAIGSFLNSTGAKAKVATKIGYFPRSKYYHDSAKLVAACEASAARLQYRPDLIFMHEADWKIWWDRNAPQGQSVTPQDAYSIGDNIRSLKHSLLKRGTSIGIAGNCATGLESVYRMSSQTEWEVVLIAKQYDLVWRNASSFAELLGRTKKIRCWLAAPFHQGWLFRLDQLSRLVPESTAQVRAVQGLLAKFRLTPAEVALPFIRATRPYASVVIGVEAIGELDNARAAYNRCIPAELIASLQCLHWCHKAMPGPLRVNSERTSYKV